MSVFSAENTSVSRPVMGSAGNGVGLSGPAGVTTATALGATADFDDGAGRGVTAAAVGEGAGALIEAAPDFGDPALGRGPSLSAMSCTAARASSMTWRASGVGLVTTGIAAGGVVRVSAMTSGPVRGAGLPSSPAESFGADDAVPGSGAADDVVLPPGVEVPASVSVSEVVARGDRDDPSGEA